MLPIQYFKLQAKHLHSDLQTRTSPSTDFGMFYDDFYYDYNPKFFNVKQLLWDMGLSEEPKKLFGLMRCQHIIANLAGFKSWNCLIHATEEKLELARIVFENQNKIHPAQWEEFITEIKTRQEKQGLSPLSLSREKELYQQTLANYDPNDPFNFSGYLLLEEN